MPGNPFYSSPAWRALRAAKLRQNFVCETPGCNRPAKIVDHIRSMRSGGPALDIAATRALCWSCHSQKTVRTDGGFGRTPSGPRGCDANGMPVDPGHRWNRSRP